MPHSDQHAAWEDDQSEKLQEAYGLWVDADMPDGSGDDAGTPLSPAWRARLSVVDADREVVIFSSPAHCEAAKAELAAEGVPTEPLALWRLPKRLELALTFTDYGFISEGGTPYVNAGLAAVVRLIAAAHGTAEADLRQAEAQLAEHALARYVVPEGKGFAFVIELQHQELAERLAAAYGAQAVWLRPDGAR